MCADHTLCMHDVHPPPQITHSTLSQLHADGMWIGREGEEGGRSERKGQLTPSLHHTSSRHTSPLLPLFPPSHLPSTPTTHTHTIISIDLPDNHLHITAPPTQPASPHTHTHTRPNPHPLHVPVHRGHAAAAAAAPLLAFLTTTTSSPCPPPPACHTCTHKQQVVHV